MRALKNGLLLSAALLTGLSSAPGLSQAPAPAGAAQATRPIETCDTASIQALAPQDTTVSFAAREGGICRVMGHVTTQNPGPNKVLFTLGLPSNFAGRYVYLGVGGAAGSLPALRPELIAKGYAVSGSDGGTGSPNGSDFSFKSDPAKHEDFMGRGVHVVAKATQAITRAYYNQPKIYRYISGCSGGGQMGLTNALRFGSENFDGFIVGATPMPGRTSFGVNAYRLMQYLQTHPDAWVSPDLLKKADAAILAAYDATDGAVDGIIADQRNIKQFDTGILRQVGFTPAQIKMFDMIRNPQQLPGPGGTTRTQPGYPITDVEFWENYIFGTAPPPWPSTESMTAAQVGRLGAPFFHRMADTNVRAVYPGRDYTKMKFNDLANIAIAAQGAHPRIPDTEAAFNKFATSGAKLIFYHGVDDDAMSYFEMIGNHEELVRTHADAPNWLRLYTMPGLRHCRGGPGTSNSEEPLIEAVANWVEKGEAPQEVLAERVTSARGLERIFLLCPEPKRGFLKRPGLDVTKAENWECRVS